MLLKPIKNEKDYDKALERVDALMALNPEFGTAQSDELEISAMLTDKYEDKHYLLILV